MTGPTLGCLRASSPRCASATARARSTSAESASPARSGLQGGTVQFAVMLTAEEIERFHSEVESLRFDVQRLTENVAAGAYACATAFPEDN